MKTIQYHVSAVRGIVQIDKNRIAYPAQDGTIKILNLATQTAEQMMFSNEDWVLCIKLIDINRIVYSTYEGLLKIWNLQTSKIEQVLYGHKDAIRDVLVIDGDRIISASDDHTLKLWNLANGEVLNSLVLEGTPKCIALSKQDSHTLIIAGDAAGALYCLELVEPVASDKATR